MAEKIIEIKDLKKHFDSDTVLVSEHASMRFRQRGVKIRDVRCAVSNGDIIEQYPDDHPFPSCLILGKTNDDRYLHIVMSDEGTSSRIITAYYPDPEIWDNDFKQRRKK